jgi:alpha-beta hydrolase superfamily lysophospholipase
MHIMKMVFSILLIASLIFFQKVVIASESNEITPYKFTDKSMPSYSIPNSSRFIIKRSAINAPNIVYYFSKPKKINYSIAILCGGSSSKDDIGSIIHFHRYFLREFMNLGVGVLTVEQWGVDGNEINKNEFMKHYTRSQRLQDHKTVIENIRKNPPKGWNGRFIFLGVSEGGPIVTTLTEQYSNIIIATINWSGAGDWSWREELWVFLKKLLTESGECKQHSLLNDCRTITSRDRYDARMDAIIHNPTSGQYFFGMTYKYHADALLYPTVEYQKIRAPFLVVAGAKDTNIQSSDAFVRKAKNAGVNITYLRVSDMDHYIRKRPEMIQRSFEWLQNQLDKAHYSLP